MRRTVLASHEACGFVRPCCGSHGDGLPAMAFSQAQKDGGSIVASLDTGGVLGAFSGFLVVDGGFSAIHETIEKLAGVPVWTHQLGRVMEELSARYLPLNPQIADAVKAIETSFAASKESGLKKAAELIEAFGPTIEIEILPPAEMVEPISELRQMMPPTAVVIPVASAGEGK